MDDLVEVDPKKIEKYNAQIPRYTSYPTAPNFKDLSPKVYEEALFAFAKTEKPLSLYIHIPFCKSMCLFCGCSVILNRKPKKQEDYVDYLLREIDIVAKHFGKKRLVQQLHFGGGTPTNLTEEQFVKVFAKLRKHFVIAGEISIEIDPRNIVMDGGKKLQFLRMLFNRVSFGVQDIDPKVQEAVKRRQTEEMTRKTFLWARELNFSGINIDLIYGLPFQTRESFHKTAEAIIDMGPDRIAFFSYAKIPWLKPHQKAIDDAALPAAREKFQIYTEARALFMRAGYAAIGMDHFAKKQDSLTKAYFDKKLYRNFQGYSLKLASDMVGFGITSVGFLSGVYVQNKKTIAEYVESIEEKKLPVFRGLVQTKDDQTRYDIIQEIMCSFEAHLPDGFEKEKEALLEMEELVKIQGNFLQATPLGRLFIRNIASVFDAYLEQGAFLGFSRSV